MRKIYIILVCVLALVSCTEELSMPEKTAHVSLNPSIEDAVSVRSIITSTSFPASRSINAYAYKSNTAYFSDEEFTYATTDWKPVSGLIWPGSDRIDMLLYSKGSANVTASSSVSTNLTLSSSDFSKDDVLYGVISQADENNNSVSFRHALTRLTFTAMSTSSSTIKIKSLMVGAKVGATINITRTAGTSTTSISTSVNGQTQEKQILTGEYTVGSSAAGNASMSEGIVIPSQEPSIIVTYTMTNGNVESAPNTVMMNLDTVCLEGSSYDVLLSFSSDKLEIDVSLTPWIVTEPIALQAELRPSYDGLSGTAYGHEWVDFGVRETVNGVTYKVLFAKTNIGADSLEEYGDYFAWAEVTPRYESISGADITGAYYDWDNCPYHVGSNQNDSNSWTKYKNESSLEKMDDAACMNWGGEWVMPTKSQFENLLNNSELIWVTNYNGTGANGLLINSVNYFVGNSIFIPANGEAELYAVKNFNRDINLWMKNRANSATLEAYFYTTSSGTIRKDIQRYGYRRNGMTIRPVIVVPDNSNKPVGDPNFYIPLTFIIKGEGTITWALGSKTVLYSKNEGEWTTMDAETSISVSNGDKVEFKGTNTNYDSNTVTCTAPFDLKGNIMSVIGGDDYLSVKNFTTNNHFTAMFKNNSTLVSAKNLKLPMTSLRPNGYKQMFLNCTSLIEAPELPATSLSSSTYEQMFMGCSSLITAPDLPATTVGQGSYSQMFQDCTSLVNVPDVLPATTLGRWTYASTFRNCTSLTKAPNLPATELTESCYVNMFYGCTNLQEVQDILPATTLTNTCYEYMFADCSSLTRAPELPALTLVYHCYNHMFTGCSSLSYIKALFTNDPESGDAMTTGWVTNVAPTGTFVKNAEATWDNVGVNGVPTGWTIESKYTFNGHDAVDLGIRENISGTNYKILFATTNIGADNPEDYGDYYAWGETSKRYSRIEGNTIVDSSFDPSNCPFHTGDSEHNGYTKYVWEAYYGYNNYVDKIYMLESQDDIANITWGGNWKIPNLSELNYLKNSSYVTYTWVSNYNNTGIAGGLFTGKGDYSGNSIFIPAGGITSTSNVPNRTLTDVNETGQIWSSEIRSSSTSTAYKMFFGNGYLNVNDSQRYSARNVRPVIAVPL